MAFAYFDRVKETSTTTGTGTIALAGAVSGFNPFSAVYANSDTLHYTIYHPGSGAWEVGLGTWSTGNNLARTTVLASSNSGALVNFAAGSKEVFVCFPAVIESTQGATFFSVADQATRDAIPTAALRLGSIVRLLSTGAFFHWNGAAWVTFAGFAPVGSAAGQVQVWNGTAWTAGAVDLADLDAITGKLAFSNVVDIAGLSVAGRASNSPGELAAITAANDFEVLRRFGATLGFGTISTGGIGNGQVTLPKIADGTALSVLGRSAGTSGPYADIASSADGQAFRRAGGVLGWGPIDLADLDAVTNKLAFSNVSDLDGLSVLARATNSAGTLAALTASTPGNVLQLNVTGTALVFGLLQTTAFADNTIGLNRLTQASGAGVIGHASDTPGFWQEILTNVDGQVFRRAVGTVGWGAIDLADLDAVAGLLAPTNFAPSGTNGRVLVTTAGVATWGFALGNNTDAFSYNGATHTFQIAGATALAIGGGNVNAQANNFVTTGVISLGASPASLGHVRLPNGAAASDGIQFANGVGLGSIRALALDGSDVLILGEALYADATKTYPTVGMLRAWHNVQLITGRDTGGADRNGVRWGASSTDTWTFGDAAVAAQLVGTSVLIGDSTEMIETASLATNREIISLLLGATLSTTQMPALTGDKVMFWANATAMPGVGSTSFPAGGVILGVDSTLGLEGKGANGVETTLVPHGDAGNTTKRRMFGVKARAKRTAMLASTGPTTIAEFDVAAVNGGAITTGTFRAIGHYIAKSSTYSQVGAAMAVVDVIAGVPAVGSGQSDRTGHNGGSPFTNLVFDTSGTVVRLQATTSAFADVEIFALIELMEFEV